ncbi:LPS O-antigen subunit length determinant protein (WzzB/FepE family) [Pseudomonas sp. 2835]
MCVTSISRIPPVSQSSDIDFFAVVQSLWKQKFLIVAVTLAVGAAAGAYAFLTTPEYQVSTTLRPAALNDLDALNRSGVYSLPREQALTRVGAALDSYDVRLGYFRANPQLFAPLRMPGQTDEQAFEEFNRNSIKLVQPDPKKKVDLLSAYIGMELRYPKNVDGDEILNGFVKYAIESERQQVASDLSVIIKNRLNELDGKLDAARAGYEAGKESQIATLLEKDNLTRAQLQDELRALRVQLKARRADRIAQLDEAISIARSLGLKKPSTPSAMASEGESGGNVIRTEVNNQQIPLYFMGTDALEAERKALRQRTSDDFTDPRVAQIGKELMLLKNNRRIESLKQRENEDVFLQNIEPLRSEMARLKKLDIDVMRLNLVTIDQYALEPLKPIWPKKSLMILAGLAVGGMLGVLLAIIRYFVVLRMTKVAKGGEPLGNPQ